MRVLNHKPAALAGHNFITRDPLGYWSGRRKGVRIFAELSQGEGIRHNPIFGVTVRTENQDDPEGLSRLFNEGPDPEKDARKYIEQLDEDQ